MTVIESSTSFAKYYRQTENNSLTSMVVEFLFVYVRRQLARQFSVVRYSKGSFTSDVTFVQCCHQTEILINSTTMHFLVIIIIVLVVLVNIIIGECI